MGVCLPQQTRKAPPVYRIIFKANANSANERVPFQNSDEESSMEQTESVGTIMRVSNRITTKKDDPAPTIKWSPENSYFFSTDDVVRLWAKWTNRKVDIIYACGLVKFK